MKKILGYIVRSILVISSVIFFILFVFPMTIRITNIGNIAGAALCVWVFCVSLKPLHRRIKRFCRRFLLTKIIYRVVNAAFIAFAVYGVIVSGAMVYAMAQVPSGDATVVLLGAQVRGSGEPSLILNGRINAAERYLKENLKTKAVLSGGQGEDEPFSEAACMYDLLKKSGIEESRLFMEDKSKNTKENLKFSSEIIEANRLNKNLAIATDGFHQLRARIIANQLGLKGDVGAINSDTQFQYLPTYFVREWFAIPYQLLLQ